jgi:hypothetical protein
LTNPFRGIRVKGSVGSGKSESVPKQPRNWQVGGLCHTPEERFIISLMRVYNDDAEVITESGTIRIIDLDNLHSEKHNTGLNDYYYTSHQQIIQPFFYALL